MSKPDTFPQESTMQEPATGDNHRVKAIAAIFALGLQRLHTKQPSAAKKIAPKP